MAYLSARVGLTEGSRVMTWRYPHLHSAVPIGDEYRERESHSRRDCRPVWTRLTDFIFAWLVATFTLGLLGAFGVDWGPLAGLISILTTVGMFVAYRGRRCSKAH